MIKRHLRGVRPKGAVVREETVKVEIDRAGPVTTVTLNRPDCRNAVDPEMARALYDAFVDFARDPEAHVAVLYGKGGAFCPGFDLKALSEDADGYSSCTSARTSEILQWAQWVPHD